MYPWYLLCSLLILGDYNPIYTHYKRAYIEISYKGYYPLIIAGPQKPTSWTPIWGFDPVWLEIWVTRWGFGIFFFRGFLAAENFRKVPKKMKDFWRKSKSSLKYWGVFFCWGGIKEELHSLKLTNRSWKSISFLGFIPSKWWTSHGHVSLQRYLFSFFCLPTKMHEVSGGWQVDDPLWSLFVINQ